MNVDFEDLNEEAQKMLTDKDVCEIEIDGYLYVPHYSLSELKMALDECTYSFDGRSKMEEAYDKFLKSLQIWRRI